MKPISQILEKSVTCHKCKEQIVVGIPQGWAINLVGILQVIHVPCGTILNLGGERMYMDKDLQEIIERDQQEGIIGDNLFKTVGEALEDKKSKKKSHD